MPYKDPDKRRAAARDWAKRNRSNTSAHRKAAKVKQREQINQLKSVPCADCGGSFPPVCMDFDHLPEFDKVLDVSRMYRGSTPMETILAEIAKCEVVCANCHRIRSCQRNPGCST